MEKKFLSIHNGQTAPYSAIPRLAMADFRTAVCAEVGLGNRIAAMFGRREKLGHVLIAILADDKNGRLHIALSEVENEYPSLTPDCLRAHLFEREIFEAHGIKPVGHPWLKPVRFPEKSFHPDKKIGGMDYFRVKGNEVHEVAVGPVHAGVIEPGHFRFQCHGEKVFHLEISLGYQHRGVEKAFLTTPVGQRIHLAETVSGDSTCGHALAYCGVAQSLSTCRVPARAQVIRGILLELERIACHIGDLGALSGDVGFLPTSAFCGRIRGNVLNMTAEICGNRFSRGIIREGGVAFDVTPEIIERLLAGLKKVRTDAADAINLLWTTPTVMARFEGTGIVSKIDALKIGLVGVAARACGINRDVRQDHAHCIFQFQQIPISTAETGDVLARAMIRWLEISRSITFVEEMLSSLPQSEISHSPTAPKPNSLVVCLVEGWRGEICHVGLTGENGELSDYKIVDPSFHNWFGLALALRNEAISDFPLCNKSFNLSYCGFDL